MLSTGQIFLIIGMCGIVFAAILTVVSITLFHKKEKKIKQEIWKEYR